MLTMPNDPISALTEDRELNPAADPIDATTIRSPGETDAAE